MSQAVARVLSDAADIIERDGWVQGRYFSNTHAHPAFYNGSGACALGALRVAAWREEMLPRYESAVRRLEGDAIRALETHLIEVASDDVRIRARDRLVGTWNDDRRRTKDEVVAALRATAEKEGCW